MIIFILYTNDDNIFVQYFKRKHTAMLSVGLKNAGDPQATAGDHMRPQESRADRRRRKWIPTRRPKGPQEN